MIYKSSQYEYCQQTRIVSQTVLLAPYVEVHWHKLGNFPGAERQVHVFRVQEAQEVPGRIHESVHRVRLAHGLAPTSAVTK